MSGRIQLETILMRAWMRRGLLAALLLPLAWLFGRATALRRGLYRAGLKSSTRLPVPVIVVGNIFIGGTGKTPLVIWLAQALRRAGYAPGVISRGYGAAACGVLAVGSDSSPIVAGDEPVLIAQRAQCPVMVGRDRVKAAQALLAAHPEIDIIVSDDGLQHYRLQRDVEILLFDERGIGNGWLLPAGPLRESSHRPRDFTVVNAAAAAGLPADAITLHLTGSRAVRLSDPSQSLDLKSLAAGKTRILAAAGIGNPARFFSLLRAAGVQCIEMPLPDHYDYAANPFARIEADLILVTEKDAVKCRHRDALKNDARLWVVPVEAQPDGLLLEKILEKLRGLTTA